MLYHAFGIYKTTPIKKNLSIQGASVLIPIRNDAHHIPKLLDCLLKQKNVSIPIQILVIDDHSQDNLQQVLQPYLQRIEYIALPYPKKGKKEAIEYGILQSKYDIIITTDADCTMGDEWLFTLLSCFEEDTQFISAPVILQGNSLFEHIQRIELMGLIGIGAGAIYHQKPNLCNGANLAYRKSAFISLKGYEGSKHLASGDDELLMHKIHAHYKNGIRFCKNVNAIVYTPAQPTLKTFVQQRKRWISKAQHYQRKGLTTQLIGLYSFYFVLLISTLLCLFYYKLVPICITLWIGKILAEYTIMLPIMLFFKQNILKDSFIFVTSQFFQCMYVIWAGLVSLRPRFTWKNRNYE